MFIRDGIHSEFFFFFFFFFFRHTKLCWQECVGPRLCTFVLLLPFPLSIKPLALHQLPPTLILDCDTLCS
eukprot:NODE_847_length_581_cov_198.682819_g837_i0.p3 GENE.NODE_847_length_581_cov_198.682819_g837_i0~~NODE_847_length_581_cov_198.682819_g837_i0.p3  ORF type:complete len:70 (+),score=22.12 NODE_847_length_581_cov_198.682819_g837_i0:1-210(+)